MAVTMELTDSASDSKLLKDSKTPSLVSLSKSENNASEQTVTDDQLSLFKHWVSNDRWNQLKSLAEIAMKDKKIFMIKGGGYPAVRRALNERGFVEKLESQRVKTLSAKKFSGSTKESLSRVEKMILFKFLEHHDVDFLWTTKRNKYDYLLSNKEITISRFCRSLFTSKEGLCALLTQMHWHTEPGVAMTMFPRCYNIHNAEHMEEFIEDFRLTACISMCKWLTTTLKQVGEENMVSDIGRIPVLAIYFAMSRLEEFIAFATHKDIDEAQDDAKHIWEHEWDQFLTHHYLLVHEGAKFLIDPNTSLKSLEKKTSKLLTIASRHWPQVALDGIHNIWIVKPGNKCRGKGIQLMNNIKNIMNLTNYQTPQKTRFVVQKYIENPLCVYNTKFDIRQWFLVTNCQPLTIWMYRDSYLRFSSQIFSLSNYHESVHLTNNSVQSKYKNNGKRDPALPDENMWDCHTFKTYLRQLGKAEVWDEKIYPGMKQCLVGAMLACQETMDKRQNSFELYGADFMLTEDFTPWLIEINSSPDLAPTTSVTARMCPQCLEDVIKVVVDKRLNPEADTGTFELAYRQTFPKLPAYLGLSLIANGRRIFKKSKHHEKRQDKSWVAPVTSYSTQPPALPEKPLFLSELEKIPKKSSSLNSDGYSGPIITDFISWLNPYDDVGPKDAVRPTLSIIKPTFTVKNNKDKKPTPIKERVISSKRIIAPKFVCRPKSSGSKIVPKAVGNKRCYIDPEEWDKKFNNSINRSTESVRNKLSTNPLVTICKNNAWNKGLSQPSNIEIVEIKNQSRKLSTYS